MPPKPAEPSSEKTRLIAGGDIKMSFQKISHSDTQVSNKGSPFGQGLAFKDFFRGGRK